MTPSPVELDSYCWVLAGFRGRRGTRRWGREGKRVEGGGGPLDGCGGGGGRSRAGEVLRSRFGRRLRRGSVVARGGGVRGPKWSEAGRSEEREGKSSPV